MKSHTKIYLDAFGYDVTDFIPSELSGAKGQDLHHIKCKGMGGNPSKDKERIENYIMLTRDEHDFYGDKPQYMAFLYKKHMQFLEVNGVKFDRQYMLNQIEKYSLCTA